ncbi:LacI family DNA-binding transcriptional regulator [Quadrisphaera sp. INWT6]|uniref:LacI family DNA-binding transcriptional regulator n=1 Tax=Quadrisphaera sp. INWT6 TaxID=2596917 RepID=UPI0019D63A7B|nr:LacI family DNA-binding transcriptional regulator [Quadrisphaera sp. INWT6]
MISPDSAAPARTPARAVVMVDVAREAGVSQKTVSRVVNGSDQVRPEVRDRVLAVIDSLGYRRNSAARALAAGRTHLIGIVAMGTPLFGIAEHVVGAERAARERGYGTVVVSLSEAGDAAEVGPALDRALALGAEGLVLVEPFRRDPALLAPWADVPIVSPRHDEGPDADTSPLHSHVTVDEEHIGRLATEHLLALGHRSVAHLAGPLAWQPAELREQGWRAALAEGGGEAVGPVRGDWSARSGYRAAQELLRRGEVFTALFAANDSMAVGAVRALVEAGVRVPQDVAVVGVDDLPESEFQVVPLTSVKQDFAALTHRSVEHLVGSLEGEPPADRAEVVLARLVVRASSGAPLGPPGATSGASP